MNAQRLLAELQQSGVVLGLRGDRLHVDAPKGVVSEELRKQMLRQKPDLMRLLRTDSGMQESGDARVAAMRLDEFARAGLIVQVRSEVLGTEILFASDDVPESKLKDRPEVVYRAHELKKLARVPPDPQHLRTIQMVREIFGGTIRDVRVLRCETVPVCGDATVLRSRLGLDPPIRG